MTAARTLRWLALALAGAILLALVSIDGDWQPPLRQEPAVPVALTATADPEIGDEQLAEIVARPLFLPSRRPPEAVAATAAEEAPPPDPLADVKLLGIYGSGATAGILVSKGTEVSRLSSGGQWQGWRLLSVGTTEVTLIAADGAQQTLTLERGPQQGGMVAAPAPAGKAKTKAANADGAGQPQGSRGNSAERQALLRAARERATRSNMTR